MSKTLFVACGNYTWASARMRCYWPAKYMRNAEVVEKRLMPAAPNADTMIWQKLVDYEFIRAYPNRRHYWDVCDPSWWWGPYAAREVADTVTGVVVSSPALRDDFNSWYGQDKAVCIPDRLDLEHFPVQRQHADTSPVRFIWFGLALNRISIFGQLANLERLVANGHRIELTILDNRPDEPFTVSDMFPIRHKKWDVNTENAVIAAHDIALLPPYPGPWGKVKSNNKQLTAWACGLPTVTDDCYSEVENVVSNRSRRASPAYRFEIDENWTADKSAREWEALLNG